MQNANLCTECFFTIKQSMTLINAFEKKYVNLIIPYMKQSRMENTQK